jgi:hypothetical protein
MFKLIANPGSGKTRLLMERCVDENATFVCKNPEAMLVKAYSYGLEHLNIISYIEYLQNSSDYKYNCYLDDIDEFLEAIGCKVKGFGGNL